MGKNVIAMYNHESYRDNPRFWGSINVDWDEDATTIDKLKAFLERILAKESRDTELHSTMAHLSFSRWTIFKDAIPLDIFGVWNNGIRNMTQELAKHINKWYLIAIYLVKYVVSLNFSPKVSLLFLEDR